MKIPFYKMNGAGNDFIVIDNRGNILENFNVNNFVKLVCRRRKSIGADGLMTLENSTKADFRMRYFNSDGSEGEMCGNGARCIAKFAYLAGAAKERMKFETMSGMHEALILGDDVRVMFPDLDSNTFKFNQKHDFGFGRIEYHFATVGVPHAVIYRNDVELMNDDLLKDFGRKIRYALDVFPKGTNVNFVKVSGEKEIVVRTYERGVEEETLACGTGSIASAVISSLLKGVNQPVKVKVRGGILEVGFNAFGNTIKNVYLQGDARVVAHGYILEDALKE
ncbi:MAG: diaminopimelate epimerase [Pseudothermotoga sp.]